MTFELITESAHKLFEKDYDLGFMRRFRASDKPGKHQLVQLCQEMGWHGLIIGEEHGGFGYELDALCALLQELGHAAFPSLYFSHFVAPALLLSALDDSPAKSRLLGAVAAGEMVPSVATNSATAESFSGATAFRAEVEGQDLSISGTAQFICDLDSASVLVVPARMSDGSIAVFAVEKGSNGVLIGERADHVYGTTFSATFSNVVPGREAALGTMSKAVALDVYSRCAIAQSAQILGCAQRAMALAIAHILVRKQFGKLLAEFQAVQHQAADMYKVADVGQLLLHEAIDQRQGDGLPLCASQCKAWANDAGFQIGATSHQLMGGTGYMRETDLHLLTDLVLRGQYEFGSADYHRELIASRVHERSAEL